MMNGAQQRDVPLLRIVRDADAAPPMDLERVADAVVDRLMTAYLSRRAADEDERRRIGLGIVAAPSTTIPTPPSGAS